MMRIVAMIVLAVMILFLIISLASQVAERAIVETDEKQTSDFHRCASYCGSAPLVVRWSDSGSTMIECRCNEVFNE